MENVSRLFTTMEKVSHLCTAMEKGESFFFIQTGFNCSFVVKCRNAKSHFLTTMEKCFIYLQQLKE